jgi:hypothetical protein
MSEKLRVIGYGKDRAAALADADQVAARYYGTGLKVAGTPVSARVDERQDVRTLGDAESEIAVLRFGIVVEFEAVRPF